MPKGRPTDYTPELLALAHDYVENCPDKIHSIEGLADHIGITRKTVYEWIKDPEKSDFCYIYDTVLKKQGKTLINKGLDGEFNATITKLMLTKHGYSDKIETEHSGSLDINQMSDDDLDRRITSLMNK